MTAFDSLDILSGWKIGVVTTLSGFEEGELFFAQVANAVDLAVEGDGPHAARRGKGRDGLGGYRGGQPVDDEPRQRQQRAVAPHAGRAGADAGPGDGAGQPLGLGLEVHLLELVVGDLEEVAQGKINYRYRV